MNHVLNGANAMNRVTAARVACGLPAENLEAHEKAVDSALCLSYISVTGDAGQEVARVYQQGDEALLRGNLKVLLSGRTSCSQIDVAPYLRFLVLLFPVIGYLSADGFTHLNGATRLLDETANATSYVSNTEAIRVLLDQTRYSLRISAFIQALAIAALVHSTGVVRTMHVFIVQRFDQSRTRTYERPPHGFKAPGRVQIVLTATMFAAVCVAPELVAIDELVGGIQDSDNSLTTIGYCSALTLIVLLEVLVFPAAARELIDIVMGCVFEETAAQHAARRSQLQSPSFQQMLSFYRHANRGRLPWTGVPLATAVPLEVPLLAR